MTSWSCDELHWAIPLTTSHYITCYTEGLWQYIANCVGLGKMKPVFTYLMMWCNFVIIRKWSRYQHNWTSFFILLRFPKKSLTRDFRSAAFKREFVVFWVVVQCSVGAGYQRFGGTCCLNLHFNPENGGTKHMSTTLAAALCGAKRNCSVSAVISGSIRSSFGSSLKWNILKYGDLSKSI